MSTTGGHTGIYHKIPVFYLDVHFSGLPRRIVTPSERSRTKIKIPALGQKMRPRGHRALAQGGYFSSVCVVRPPERNALHRYQSGSFLARFASGYRNVYEITRVPALNGGDLLLT